jgi:hypothetical protein
MSHTVGASAVRHSPTSLPLETFPTLPPLPESPDPISSSSGGRDPDRPSSSTGGEEGSASEKADGALSFVSTAGSNSDSVGTSSSLDLITSGIVHLAPRSTWSDSDSTGGSRSNKLTRPRVAQFNRAWSKTESSNLGSSADGSKSGGDNDPNDAGKSDDAQPGEPSGPLPPFVDGIGPGSSLSVDRDESGLYTTTRFEHIADENGHRVITGRAGKITRCEDEVKRLLVLCGHSSQRLVANYLVLFCVHPNASQL